VFQRRDLSQPLLQDCQAPLHLLQGSLLVAELLSQRSGRLFRLDEAPLYELGPRRVTRQRS